MNELRTLPGFARPPRLARRRAARAGRAAELPRPPDAGGDEVLGDGRHPRHRARGELGHDARLVQVGLRLPQPDRRLCRGPLQPAPRHLRQPVRLVGRDLATGHVTTYEQLLATRALMGISEAFYIPAALALIADYHAGPTRSRAVGLHQMAIYCRRDRRRLRRLRRRQPGLGWRLAFDACGLVGMLYAVPLFLLLRNPPRPDRTRRIGRPSPAGSACANCSATSRSSCWCSTSRCRRWRAGSCATGCRRS